MDAISVRYSRNILLKVIAFGMVIFLLLACTFGGALQSTGQDEVGPAEGEATDASAGGGEGSGQLEVPTPTPTAVVQEAPVTPPIPTSMCGGLNGELELQLLVGPADAVGLEPYSVGTIPFSVTTSEAPFIVSGGGQLDYADMLVEEWGSYSVDLFMNTIVIGECVDRGTDGELHLTVGADGTQMVEVIAEGFHGEYPWEGEISFEFVFPLEEGASSEGEGWVFVLHLPAE